MIIDMAHSHDLKAEAELMCVAGVVVVVVVWPIPHIFKTNDNRWVSLTSSNVSLALSTSILKTRSETTGCVCLLVCKQDTCLLCVCV